MKKGIFILGLLISAFSFFPPQQVDAQTSLSTLNGPRKVPLRVAETVNQWIDIHEVSSDVEEVWWHTVYTYIGKGQWQVYITWGEGAIIGEDLLGSATLIIRNNGTLISEEIGNEE